MVTYSFYTSRSKNAASLVYRTNTGYSFEKLNLKEFETKEKADLDFYSLLYDNEDFRIGEYFGLKDKKNGKQLKVPKAVTIETGIEYVSEDIHKFPALWTLKDAIFTKDKGSVFSCFACGGGSTMGYKLSGFNVIGCNEIDKEMNACYVKNHNPKHNFLMPIQEFILLEKFPEELYNLDILDGSPPCSSFSMAGDRAEAWGEEKVFREGQQSQVLDTLFFDFITLCDRLKPKVCVAENVKGLLMGEARKYVREIYERFDEAGYRVQHWLLDASKMGVPQKRERVFFVAIRKDLATPFLQQFDLYDLRPKLNLDFNYPEIKFGEVRSRYGVDKSDTERGKLMAYRAVGDKTCADINKRLTPGKLSGFNSMIRYDDEVCGTITAGEKDWRFVDGMACSDHDYCACGTYPLDYDFLATSEDKVKYMVGMSVPPVMVAQIATRIYEQWLSKI